MSSKGSDWSEIRRQVKHRDKGRCARCYEKVDKATAHHILPRSEGGTDLLANLVWMCHPCHDFVEVADPPLRNRAEIEGSWSEAGATIAAVSKTSYGEVGSPYEILPTPEKEVPQARITPHLPPDSDPKRQNGGLWAGCLACKVKMQPFETLAKLNAWVYKHQGSKKHQS